MSLHYRIYALTNAKTKNNVAVITVPRWRTKSSPRAFCFPKSCSAPPEIAPDSPALLPDCKTINTIIIIALITNMILITLAIKQHPL